MCIYAVLVARIFKQTDGTLRCEVKICNILVHKNVSYKWIEIPEQSNKHVEKTVGINDLLLQQRSVFVSHTKYKCHVRYTIMKMKCCKPMEATSNTITMEKKGKLLLQYTLIVWFLLL